MNKFDGITTQAVVYKTNTKTTAFYCNFHPTDVSHFAELVEGKVKITLNDFSKGKDYAKKVFFNLDLNMVHWLYECSKTGKMEENEYYEKIHTDQSCSEPSLFHYERIWIGTQNPDKDNKTWVIQIENGIAALEQTNSFRIKKDSERNKIVAFEKFTKMDFYHLFYKIIKYENVFCSIYAKPIVMQGLELYQKNKQIYQENQMQNKDTTHNQTIQPETKNTIKNQPIPDCIRAQAQFCCGMQCTTTFYITKMRMNQEEYLVRFPLHTPNSILEMANNKEMIVLDFHRLDERTYECVTMF